MSDKKLKVKPVTKKTEVKAVKVAAKAVKPAVVKKSTGSTKVDVYDVKGKVLETIELSKEIFGEKENKQLISQAVRVYLANQRKGTASTKTRGEVRGSTRKIYRQKGTGRARHGSVRAPIFVHGGIVSGPKPRDFSLKFPKRMKRKALFCALSSKLKAGEIKIVSGLLKIEPKTKKMVEVLENLKLSNGKILLILPKDCENLKRAARNIRNIEYISAFNMNTYSVLNNKGMLFARESIEEFEKTLKGENK